MKKFFCMALAAMFAILTINSCSKDEGETYYTFNLNYHTGNNSNIHAIEQALGDRYNTHYKTENQARQEWKAFLSAVDDSQVKCASDDYYEVLLVKMGQKGQYFEVVKTLEKVRWDSTGRH